VSQSIKKERLPQLDLFRAMAIFCVIQVHSSSFAAAEQALNSPIYYFYNWMNIFFKIGTPCFIFLSSFVLFYNYYDRPVNKFCCFLIRKCNKAMAINNVTTIYISFSLLNRIEFVPSSENLLITGFKGLNLSSSISFNS